MAGGKGENSAGIVSGQLVRSGVRRDFDSRGGGNEELGGEKPVAWNRHLASWAAFRIEAIKD